MYCVRLAVSLQKQKKKRMSEDFDIRDESLSTAEKEFENALRPLKFADFNGQKNVVENLGIFVEAAKYRGEPLDHTLLYGPPGLGRLHLAILLPMNLAWDSK